MSQLKIQRGKLLVVRSKIDQTIIENNRNYDKSSEETLREAKNALLEDCDKSFCVDSFEREKYDMPDFLEFINST